MIYTVDQQNTVHATNITIGASAGDNYVVKDGLQDGAIVVVEGINQLKDGMKITPIMAR
jgi:membrane fusion protein (multidrug efflux system)